MATLPEGWALCPKDGIAGRIPFRCRKCGYAVPASPSAPPQRASAGLDHEDYFWRQIAAAGLRQGCHRQYAWAVEERRRYQADFAWPASYFMVEIMGGAHAAGRARVSRDVERLGLAAALGWRVCAVTPGQVEDGTALALVVRGLAFGKVQDE